jgi:hypothetical protein
MEQIFAGKISPEAGLKKIVAGGNELLERFQKGAH